MNTPTLFSVNSAITVIWGLLSYLVVGFHVLWVRAFIVIEMRESAWGKNIVSED